MVTQNPLLKIKLPQIMKIPKRVKEKLNLKMDQPLLRVVNGEKTVRNGSMLLITA